MPTLGPRPDLEQLRNQATDLLREARAGDESAQARIRAVSERVVLSSAQLALAREYGFASWATLRLEVLRREILDDADRVRLSALLERDSSQASTRLEHWCDHPQGASPLGYVAMLRYDTAGKIWRDVEGTGELARILLEAGAPVEGDPGDRETTLITAASYGDAEVAAALIEAGADLEAVSAPDSGGVPNGTPLLHAAVFGMTDVIDVLVRAGVHIPDLVLAAAAGDLRAAGDLPKEGNLPTAGDRPTAGDLPTAAGEGGAQSQPAAVQDHDLDLDLWLRAQPESTRVLALVMAADHQRLAVIDQLIDAGTPVDAVDPEWQRQALREAAANGRPLSARKLLDRGADPSLTDGEGRTALELCRLGQAQYPSNPGFGEVIAILTS